MPFFVFCSIMAAAAAPAWAEVVPVDSPRWQLIGEHASVVDYKGKRALSLPQSAAVLNDANFKTGVIEFDMAMMDGGRKPSFPGVLFRAGDDGDYEHFYLRPHQSGNPDANQYTPVINNILEWQIYTAYQSQMAYRFGEWFHVRLEIAEHSARIFVDSTVPRLIAHLKLKPRRGAIALKGSSLGAYFANINIEPGHLAEAPPEQPPEDLPEGVARTWAVSEAMTEQGAFSAVKSGRLNQIRWTALPVEINGVANLARIAVRTDEKPMALARLTLRANRARSVAMRFGFSDKVRVYLNGAQLFAGDDTQALRDYRFLGAVGFWYTLQLPLRRGDNELVLAVSEGGGGTAVGGGGWAAAAAFPEANGITVRALP